MTSFNIGVNGAVLGAKRHGISRYVHQLLRHLPQVDDGKFEFSVFTDAETGTIGGVRSVDIGVSGTLSRILWDTARFPRLAKSAEVDAIHSPDKGPFFKTDVPMVATIHDLLPYLYPEERDLTNRKYWQLSLKRQAMLSDVIITVSQSTKEDVLDLFDIEADKIHVTPLGTDFSPPDETAIGDVREKFEIQHSKFSVLYVGNYNDRKNVDRIVKACRSASKDIQDIQLLLAGSNPPRSELSEIAGDFQSDIEFLGYVPDKDLQALYGAADLFVYPSSYEGFGLPVLEAMACGTPVVTSNTSSLPEVVGEAGLKVDPAKTGEIRAAVKRVYSNHDLQEELRSKGLERAEMNTWEQTARETINAYEKLP